MQENKGKIRMSIAKKSLWKLALEEDALDSVPNPGFTKLVTLFNIIPKGNFILYL